MTNNNKWNIQFLNQLKNELALNLIEEQEFDEKTIQVYSRICGTNIMKQH
jgi:hypothetical protein